VTDDPVATSPTDLLAARLELADWRRQVATLYARVRQLAADDGPAAALHHWRAEREHLYRTHPQSPVAPDQRASFAAQHFDHDPSLRFEVVVQPLSATEAAPADPSLPALPYDHVGWVDIPFPQGARRLALYWMKGYADGFFLPFRDATCGQETYGAGRYLLDGSKSADLGGEPARGTLILDFNFAYHPSCAFDVRWVCPLAPRENWLDLPVRAGERLR
jgi:uncharacterized protein (DUF1684 family)